MKLPDPKYTHRNQELKTCVDELAIALGMAIVNSHMSEMQAGVYIYSVLKLAKAAGVKKERALQPFDVVRKLAEKCWEDCEWDDAKYIVYKGPNPELKGCTAMYQNGFFQLNEYADGSKGALCFGWHKVERYLWEIDRNG